MKRVGNLMSQIADYDNIQQAFIKSCRGKQCKSEVLKFKSDYDRNISNIRQSLLSGDVEIGNYNYFKIYDPKERMICAASFRERVIHHAIMNVCHEYFERTLIYDTYATRKGKGGYKALDKAKKMALKYRYAVKLDYRKYFDSISHDILKLKLARLFKDQELLTLFDKIIDSYSIKEGKGIPIGNLTSQYFANFYLSSIDHFMKEKEGVPVYIRYMDDILMLDNDRLRLKDEFEVMSANSEKLLLQLKEPIYRDVFSGIPFLGYVVKPGYVQLSGRSKKRFSKKINECMCQYEHGFYDEYEYQQHLLPLLAFVNYAESRIFRRNIIKGVGQ